MDVAQLCGGEATAVEEALIPQVPGMVQQEAALY